MVERFILTLKTLLGCLLFVPYRQESLRRELGAVVEWYNVYRPHTRLGGKTPDEVYYGTYPANDFVLSRREVACPTAVAMQCGRLLSGNNIFCLVAYGIKHPRPDFRP